MNNATVWQGTMADAAVKEAMLKAGGYRLTAKTNSKDLRPADYLKSQHSGSSTSFEGPGGCTLSWCEQ